MNDDLLVLSASVDFISYCKVFVSLVRDVSFLCRYEEQTDRLTRPERVLQQKSQHVDPDHRHRATGSRR